MTKVKESIGRNYYQGFTGNGARDDIFKALSGVTKALYHLKSNSSYSSKAGDTDLDRLIEYFEPIVVIKGKLFEASLNSDGEIILEEKPYIQTTFNYISPNYFKDSIYSNQLVHVLTVDYLEQFLEQKNQSLEEIFKNVRSQELDKKLKMKDKLNVN